MRGLGFGKLRYGLCSWVFSLIALVFCWVAPKKLSLTSYHSRDATIAGMHSDTYQVVGLLDNGNLSSVP